MRQPVISVCALLVSFALGVATTLEMQSLRDNYFSAVVTLPALALPYDAEDGRYDCSALVVTLDREGGLTLNGVGQGSLTDTAPLVASLTSLLQEREAMRDGEDQATVLATLPGSVVYVKAPRSLPYGDLTLVLDAVERSGAKSIKLALEEDAEAF